MSKLIREEEKQEGATPAPQLLPLSDSAIITYLKACQKLSVDRARPAFVKYLDRLHHALDDGIHRAISNQEAAELTLVQKHFRTRRQDLEKYYTGYLAEGFVKFKKGQLRTFLGVDEEVSVAPSDASELSLVGNDELEETISISSITQRADAYLAEPIWALNQRFAVLNHGEQVTEPGNPAAPIQFCESLRRALRLVPMDARAKAIAYRVYDETLLELLRGTIEDINLYLKNQGILPHLRYAAPVSHAAPSSYLDNDAPPATAVGEEGVDSSQEEGEEDENQRAQRYQNDLLSAIRSLQQQLVSVTGAQSPDGTTVAIFSSDQLVNAISSVQPGIVNENTAHLGEQPVAPVDFQAFIQKFTEELKQSADNSGEVSTKDMHTIDLVGMLFEYMLNDENLPDSIKALLSYLHTPFLKIAFLDPDFFEKSEHPARLLLNQLAEAGSRWVGNDGSSQFDIYNKIKEVVNRILKEFEDDIRIIASLLLEFSGYTKNIIRRQELMEKRATEKAQGEEKLREVKLRVNEEVKTRIAGRDLPSAILLLLLQPWSDYLSFALLRYGEKSPNWNKALSVVDDILWAIEPREHSAEKAQQMDMHNELTRAVEVGLETIGYDQDKSRKLLDALSNLIKLALESKKPEPAPEPMREKLEQMAVQKAGGDALKLEPSSAEEEQMIESLKMIEFGTWFEFEGGKRLKVSWYNARTSHYMLVDQQGRKVAMISGIELARDMMEGKTKIISGSTKPFFERALENILAKLNAQADAATPEKQDHDHT